jgi:hypothetical protein
MVEVPEKLSLFTKGRVTGERSTTVTGLDSAGKASRRPKNTELEVERMIWLSSRLGHKSAFTLLLPLYDSEEGPTLYDLSGRR